MKRREFLVYVTPSLVTMIGLMVVPLFFTIYLSMTAYTYGQIPRFMGLTNYVNALQNPRFWNSLLFTLAYMCIALPIQIFIGFVLALLLDKVTKLQGLMVSTALLPNIITPVVGTLIFSWLFQDKWGFYSWILSQVGININFLANTWSARLLLILYAVWSATPFVFLVLYAGLQSISREQLESAQIDGATWFQQVVRIIIPNLAPLFSFIAMINIMDAYRVFDPIFIMTRGGPGSSTETIQYFNYTVAFGQLRLGYGSAISVLNILGILIFLVPLLVRTYREQTRG
jgi:ABC-type sugar transport system permease subunit